MSKDNKKLPDGWQSVKLGDVCEIINGSTPKSTIDEYWNGDIVWITPTDLGQLSTPIIKDSLRKITEKGYKSCNTNIVPKGSIIFSCRAPIGHIGIADVSLCTNQGCKSFILKENIDKWFLYYYIKESVPKLQSLGSGATFKEISKSKLATFPIVLPPIDEQKRIASIVNEQISTVETARKAAEAQLEAINQLPSALLRRAFNGEL